MALLRELLDSWFRQLLALLLLPAVLGVLLHVTERGTQAWLRRAIGWKGVIWWTGWLGTPVHELSHALVSILFGHRVHEVKLFEPHPDDGVLGYVKYSIPDTPWWRWWLGTIGTFFSGVAPLFGGSLVLLLALRFLAPGADGIFAEAERYARTLGLAAAADVLPGFVGLVRSIYSGIFSGGFADPRPWIFLYVALAVGAHMAPSPTDLKGGAWGFILVVLVLLVGDLIILLAGGSPKSAIASFAHVAGLLSALLMVALALNVGNLGFSFAVGALAGRRHVSVVFALLVLGVTGACGSAPKTREPVLAPRVTTRVRYQLGGPLRGEDAPGAPLEARAFEPARVLALRVSIVAVNDLPRLPLAAVIERAKLVVLEGAAERALAATPRRLATARVGTIEAPAEVENQLVTAGDRPGRLLRSVSACLPAGASVLLELGRDDASSREDAFARRTSASVVLGRRADDTGLDAALELEDPKQGGELVSIDGPTFEKPDKPGTASWAAVLPSPFEGDEARALVFIVATEPGPVGQQPGAAAHEEAIAEARRELVAQAAGASRRAARTTKEIPLPDLAATRRALEQPATARRALHALATATGSRLAEELAVTVDDLAFMPIASAVAAALGSAARAGAERPAHEVGLVVERATLASCREVLLSDDVSDELVAALERRGGAALRLLPSFGGELDRAKTLEDLERTLETQNIQLLEDASPKIRVRAARWLERRIDLMGYVALDAAADAKTAAARRREVVAQIREKRARP